jgi:hypothetical protein
VREENGRKGGARNVRGATQPEQVSNPDETFPFVLYALLGPLRSRCGSPSTLNADFTFNIYAISRLEETGDHDGKGCSVESGGEGG